MEAAAGVAAAVEVVAAAEAAVVGRRIVRRWIVRRIADRPERQSGSARSLSRPAAQHQASSIWACLPGVWSRRVGPLRISSAHASSFRLLLRRVSSCGVSSLRPSPRVSSRSLPSTGILWIESPRQFWSTGLSSVQASLLGLWVCVSQPSEFSRCTELVYRVSGAKSVDTKSSLALKAKYNAGRC